ncbi:MAG: glycoside hydrolase family 18 protein [Terracidiphilus sp.]
MFRFLYCLLLLDLATVPAFAAPAEPTTPVVTGYVFPQNGDLQPGQIDPHAMTRVNYAFAAVRGGRMTLNTSGDAANLAQLTALRKENPSLAVLISVGGWLGSGGFSDMALTAERRRAFIDSAMDCVRRYALDGVDVDWEYPGLPGAGNRFRNEDKRNFTLLLAEMRARFLEEEKKTHKWLLLTIAAGAFDDYLTHIEMGPVQRLVDAVNLMSYDYYEPGSEPLTGNHAPLFLDPDDPNKVSADATVKAFEAAGVPAEKIVLGVPFYGHAWGQVADVRHGLFQPGKAIPHMNAGYNVITSTMLGDGFTRYWDAPSQVPYLYNADKQMFVSYEDPQSLASKCRYVLSNHLAGVMFWSYFNDPSGELVRTIDHSLGLRQASDSKK